MVASEGRSDFGIYNHFLIDDQIGNKNTHFSPSMPYWMPALLIHNMPSSN